MDKNNIKNGTNNEIDRIMCNPFLSLPPTGHMLRENNGTFKFFFAMTFFFQFNDVQKLCK